jgi:hypothetical protein
MDVNGLSEALRAAQDSGVQADDRELAAMILQEAKDAQKLRDDRAAQLVQSSELADPMRKATLESLRNAVDRAREAQVNTQQVLVASECLKVHNDERARIEAGHKCSFWFIKAAKLREASKELARLPNLQALQREHPDWLERKTITLEEACEHKHVTGIVAVSHRCGERSIRSVSQRS